MSQTGIHGALATCRVLWNSVLPSPLGAVCKVAGSNLRQPLSSVLATSFRGLGNLSLFLNTTLKQAAGGVVPSHRLACMVEPTAHALRKDLQPGSKWRELQPVLCSPSCVLALHGLHLEGKGLQLLQKGTSWMAKWVPTTSTQRGYFL